MDLGGVIFVLMVLVISGFLVAKVYTGFKTQFEETVNDSTSVQIVEKGSAVADVLLKAIPFIVIGIGISAIILAFMIPSHPAFMPISIIALLIFVLLSTIFSNVLYNFLLGDEIVGLANSYPLVVNMVKYLPYIITVFGFVLIIVMYSRVE